MTALLIKLLLILVVALLFGLVVFVHELGHFLAARWLGFRITAFAIGFGPALWKKKVGHTEYRLNAIPFGGYCAVPQLDPTGMEKLQGSHNGNPNTEGGRPREPQEALPEMPPWKRILVALGGPAGNVVLAILAAWLIYTFAPPKATGALGTRIGHVDETSAAWQAGLREGQTLLKLGNRQLRTWNDFMQEATLTGNAGDLVTLTVETPDGETLTAQVPLAAKEKFSYVEGLTPSYPFHIAKVFTNTPAERAGVMAKDVVLAVNGKTTWSEKSFIKNIERNGEAPLALAVSRAGVEVTLEMTPEYDAEAGRAMIGVSMEPVAEVPLAWMTYRDPGKQLMWDAGSVKRMLGGLTSKKKVERGRAVDNIGGPLYILKMFWFSAGMGLWVSLGFIRLICVNLAVINLLPFPVLDGGHICFALWEIITRRKPSQKVVSALVNFFAIMLIGLMLAMIGWDSWRMGVEKWVGKLRNGTNQVEQVIAPTNSAPEAVAP